MTIHIKRLLCGSILTLLLACTATPLPDPSALMTGKFGTSYIAGSHDPSGRFMGGTELRVLAAHMGKLYAGNGYWEDRPGPEGPQGAQILVLDEPHGPWRVDMTFDERLPNGRPRDFAVSALGAITFATNGAGAPLPRPAAMLVASTWDLTGAARVFSRDDATGAWTATTLAQDRPLPDFLPQIRSFTLHRDRRTGVDRVFAGHSPRGIFSGVYDAATSGRIRWESSPELDIATISTTSFPGLADRLRVSSFAETGGVLYAAVGQHIYARIDGAEPHWRRAYTNTQVDLSETGLRGLTAISNPTDARDILLAAVEGKAARMVRIDPATGAETAELDLVRFLSDAWKMPVSYVIAAYNDMTKLHDAAHGDIVLIGLEAFIKLQAPVAAGHRAISVGYGRLEAGGWFLLRYPDGRYELKQITLPDAAQPLVATRTIASSPFSGDENALYLAGYDANKAPAHNSAWIARGMLDDVVSLERRANGN